MPINPTKLNAASYDARALLGLSKSLQDFVTENRAELPERVAAAVDALHAEALRACHLVTALDAMTKGANRRG